ncbi:MAG: PqqD family peptide modification chaperone [Acidobacteria bacterium]|nr:PqqD family peptide modification chaperone [Acidobacteriota bacterium]
MTLENPAVGDRVYARLTDVTLSRFGDEGLLVVSRSATQAVLNDTATRVLELVDGKRTVSEIAAHLCQEYETPDLGAVTTDVYEILIDLQGRGAVSPAR